MIRRVARLAFMAAAIPVLLVGATTLMFVVARAQGGGDVLYG
jgi:hypothetical protein